MAKSNKYKIDKIKKYVRLNKNKVIYISILIIYTLIMATIVFVNRDVFTNCTSGPVSSLMPNEDNAKPDNKSTSASGDKVDEQEDKEESKEREIFYGNEK